MKRKQVAPPPRAIEFPRADPKALAKFDPAAKVCTMNCGPHRDDPRTTDECKFLCDDCMTIEVVRAAAPRVVAACEGVALMFKHELGSIVESKTTKLRGTVTSRSEMLYGCNRYFIQPQCGADMKIPDGWWTDEEDIAIISVPESPPARRDTGGPMSKVC